MPGDAGNTLTVRIDDTSSVSSKIPSQETVPDLQWEDVPISPDISGEHRAPLMRSATFGCLNDRIDGKQGFRSDDALAGPSTPRLDEDEDLVDILQDLVPEEDRFPDRSDGSPSSSQDTQDMLMVLSLRIACCIELTQSFRRHRSTPKSPHTAAHRATPRAPSRAISGRPPITITISLALATLRTLVLA